MRTTGKPLNYASAIIRPEGGSIGVDRMIPLSLAKIRLCEHLIYQQQHRLLIYWVLRVAYGGYRDVHSDNEGARVEARGEFGAED